MKEKIDQIEQEIKSKLDIDKLKPYGSNNQGYKQLREYYSGNRSLNENIRQQLHEYRVFLAILEIFADEEETDEKIFFKPSTGRASQSATASSIFVEPALPVYPEDKLWEQHRLDYFHLRKPGDEGPKRHTKPDMLLAQSGTDRLPWKARTNTSIINETQLMRWCGRGEFERVKEELGINRTISSASDCYSAVQSTDQRESPEELYENWKEFRPNSQYIVESKHTSLTEKDYSQILWYGLAYETPLIIITEARVTNPEFKRDLKKLPVSTHIVEDFEATISCEQAQKKLSVLQ